jgi:hypothetical protein
MRERAFNIVGQPELRAWYDTLLADPEAPTVSDMEDLALFWLQESLRLTVYPSMLAASFRFHPSSRPALRVHSGGNLFR